MNVNCIICSDVLTPSAEIYTTNCGHIFHHICLIQWIERSRTCPQCRCKATEKTIHRVYFNVANTDHITDDAFTLQAKIDNLKFQITLKDKDVKIYTDKNKKLKDQNAALRSEVMDLENKQSVMDSAMHALKEQVSYFKMKAKEGNRLNDEVVRLKEKLKELEHVQLVITGSREQVNDMLRHNKDPHSLSLLVFTLKRELLEADRKYKLLNTNIKHLQNDISKYRKENSEIIKENTKLKNDIECHKNCESEKHYLKKKLIDVENKVCNTKTSVNDPDHSIDRIIMESPAPCKRRKTIELEIDFGKVNSPSIEQKVQNIKDSESPYLPIKSSNVGLSCLVNPRFKITSSQPQRNTSTFNILKNTSALENFKINKGEYNYNGLGGHSKDDQFPSPKSIVGIKRSKSTTVPASKFRKIAPNEKIKNFFTNSDE